MLLKKASITLIILCFLLFFIGACSQVPYPTTYGVSTQNKMQAATHWQILAKDTADKIAQKFPIGSKLFIEKINEEPFYPYFINFLEQELIKNKYVIVSHQTPESLPIFIQAKVLEHGERFIDVYPGLIPSVVGGTVSFLGYIGGSSTGPLSKHEVLISIKIIKNAQTLLSENNIYYINDNEVWQYDSIPDTAEASIPYKKMKVTGE